MTISGLANTNLNISNTVSANQIAESVSTTTKELDVETYVEKYFSDIPVLVEVAKCESRFRQNDKNGNTLRGVANSYDRGVMQINELYHLDRSANLGYDILELSGNVAYARVLFEKEGLRPWNSSASCWKKSQAYADYIKAGDLAVK